MTLNQTILELIEREYGRQQQTLSLIPSENYVSAAVQTAQSSCFTNKYAEGYPGKRYYGGTEVCDELEQLAQQQAQAVFNTNYRVNIQGYSGSPANLAVYLGLLKPGDTVMGMNLAAGGHLTHGHTVSATGKFFNPVQYTVNEKTHLLDYEAIRKLAEEHKPKLIIAGSTAYARTIDFAKFAEIAQAVGAYLLADISHISGLVATGLHPSPFGYADVVMTTTHKMLRGPRGALLFSKTDELAARINKAVFPGLQGGPHLHTTAAITQALFEAQEPSFSDYCQNILANAQAMVKVFQDRGFTVITGGTDNHLWLLDLRSKNMSGAEAQDKLEAVGIVCNKNGIPFDPAPPLQPSGIRLGTPAMTTRGLTPNDATALAMTICDTLEGQDTKDRVSDLVRKHPMPSVAHA